MATAMHEDEATASDDTTTPDTAARLRWKGELKKEEKNEEALITLLGVLMDEEYERCRQREPNKVLNFPRSAVIFGHYASTLLAEVPLGLTRLRMKLCVSIANAWIYCRWEEAEEFAEMFRRWPIAEDEEVSKVLRATINDSHVLLNDKIGKFFRWTNVPKEKNEIYRTFFKAMARQMTMDEIVVLGKGMHALHHASAGSVLRDFIWNACKP